MSQRDFHHLQPTGLDQRLGAVLVAAMLAVLVGVGVDAAQGPALAGAEPAAATTPAPAVVTLAATGAVGR